MILQSINSRVMLHPAVLLSVIVVAVELMFFGGLVSAFVVTRVNASLWPPLGQPRLPVSITAVNTAFLLLSLVPMNGALLTLRSGKILKTAGLLALTLCLGSAFLLLQGYEWVRLLHFGYSAAKSVYAAFFYVIVGAHAVHVFCAVVALVVLLRKVLRQVEDVAYLMIACALFWAFVVLLWPVLYYLVYFA